MVLISCTRCHEPQPETEFYTAHGKRNGRRCRSCTNKAAAQYHRARYSTEHDDNPRDCQFCGSSYQPKQRRASVYCTRICKDKARKAQDKAELAASKPPRSCEFCGEAITPKTRSDALFCSEQCNGRAHKAGRKRYAPNRDAKLRSISRLVERDGFLCGICLDPLNFEAAHPDPASVSFDHIAPLSLGGSNAESNLRLTHLACNCSRKNNP